MRLNKQNEWESSIGEYWKFSVLPDGKIKKRRTDVVFLLGSEENIAKEKESKIKEQWSRCKKYGESCWRAPNIQALVDDGVIPRGKGENIICDIAQSLGKSISKSEKTFSRLKQKLTPEQIHNAEDFGKWMIVTMTERLQTKEFKKQLGEAINSLAERDPIAAARVWLDFSERILGDKTIVQNNITGVTVFGSKGRFVPEPIDDEPIDTESREIDETNETSESEEN